MNDIFSAVQYLLVYKPTILNFTWTHGQTFASSFHFITFTVLTYLSVTFFLSRLSLPPISPLLLKSFTVLHNVLLLLLSFTMALGCFLSSISTAPSIKWIICIPPQTPPRGPLFFWAYMFYLSKIVEFIDTLLIILSNSIKRLTFLHVYHHATVVVMCYIWLETSQSLFPAVLLTNASVHVLMYTYYLSCALGVRPRWKKLLTECQILQFYSSFVVLGLMIYYHFSSGSLGCSGAWSWCFNVVFYASLLALFTDFHSKSYGNANATDKVSVNGIIATFKRP